MKFFGAITLILLVGCGQQDAPTDTAATANSSPSAPETIVAAATPAEVVTRFFEAGNAGDEETFLGLLTHKAREGMTADDADLDLANSSFESFDIGETTITGEEANVSVEAVENGETQSLTMNLRKEENAWRVFGLTMNLAEGMEFTINFETLGDMLTTMVEDMAEGLEDTFSGFGSGGSEEELAAKRARFDALRGISLDEFESSWKNAVDFRGKSAADALTLLASDLGFSIHAADHEDALAKSVDVEVAGLSKAEAIELICQAVGVYPVYPAGQLGGLGGAMVSALAEGMSTLIEGQPAVGADDDRPTVNAITFRETPRPWPVTFSGPFVVEVGGLKENPPYTTGNLHLTVRMLGLDPGLQAIVESQNELVRFDRVVDSQSRSLIDENLSYLSGGVISGQSYTTSRSLNLLNLIREVEAVHEVAGTLTLHLPRTIQLLDFPAFEEGAETSAGDLKFVLTSAGGSTEIKVTGPEDQTENLAAYYAAEDENGGNLDGFSPNVYSWEAGVAEINISAMETPSMVHVKVATDPAKVQYPFFLGPIPLEHFAEMPERVEALNFDGAETPLSATFVAVTEPDPDFAKISIKLKNNSNKDAVTVHANMFYLAEDGSEISQSSTSLSGSFSADGFEPVALKGAEVTIEATAFSMPPEAKGIRLEVWSVSFVDGTDWNSFD